MGHLDCKSGVAPCHSIEDKDIEMFCPDMPPAQIEQINAMDIEAAEEQVDDENAAEEDDVNEGASDEVTADVAKQAAGAVEQSGVTCRSSADAYDGRPTSPLGRFYRSCVSLKML
ncbi:unnamed protein product [Prunus armeniaca]